MNSERNGASRPTSCWARSHALVPLSYLRDDSLTLDSTRVPFSVSCSAATLRQSCLLASEKKELLISYIAGCPVHPLYISLPLAFKCSTKQQHLVEAPQAKTMKSRILYATCSVQKRPHWGVHCSSCPKKANLEDHPTY